MKHLSAVNYFFWKYRWRLLLGILFIVLTNYFRILSPQIAGYVVNTVVHRTEHREGNEEINKSKQNDILVQLVIKKFQEKTINQKIVWSGIVLLLLAIISGFFMFLMRQTIIVMSRLIEYDQKNQVFTHYQQLDIGFYKSHSTGDLMNRISEDIGRVRMYTGPALMYFINLAAVLGFSIFFMYKASPKLTFVALAPLPILAITIYLVNTIINKKSEKVQAVLSDLTTNAQESYSGIRVIKSFVQENAMLRFFADNSNEYRKNALSLAKTEAIYFPSMALLIGISTIITIMVGGLDVVNDPIHHQVGTIAEFVLYIQLMTFPVSAIGWTASMTQRAAASQKRINEFLQTESIIKNSPDKIKTNLQGDIEFKNVDFTYTNTGVKAITDFSLKIRQGEKVAIIGRTGSGKSTVAQLLLRMYDVDSGSVLLDGTPIEKIDLQSLRNQISYIPQDVFLFSDTVENNIAFGLDNASEKDILYAAGLSNIHNEIMSFPERYKTMIGERGVTLSGGQKQRISIARALIKDPQMVVFDDCLSAVDVKTEKQIVKNLTGYLANKTAVFITHRIFTSIGFDNIIVLEEGNLVEQGNHNSLMALKGYYYQMHTLQQSENSEFL